MILFHVSKERGIFVNYIELSVFIAYFVFMVAIGLYFFSKSKGAGEKDYFLGGRNMGAWVSALSAGASDMSAWVLMGLPASIYLSGMGQTWIAIGLGIGYAVSWIFMAPRLRRFSIAANDSITIPQYLTNRFLSKNKSLQILSAIIFLVAYTIYAASSIKACGTLFNTVMDIDPTVAMYIAAFIIVAYTFLGGFSAVCWTDFFQGMIMLAALLIAPLFALALAKAGDGARRLLQLLHHPSGHHFRPWLGPWLLRYAPHHHPVHVPEIREGTSQVQRDRHFLDDHHPDHVRPDRHRRPPVSGRN